MYQINFEALESACDLLLGFDGYETWNRNVLRTHIGQAFASFIASDSKREFIDDLSNPFHNAITCYLHALGDVLVPDGFFRSFKTVNPAIDVDLMYVRKLVVEVELGYRAFQSEVDEQILGFYRRYTNTNRYQSQGIGMSMLLLVAFVLCIFLMLIFFIVLM